MAMTDWTIVTRSLRTRFFSTATTVVSVAVAVGLMLVLLMLQASGRKAFERGTGNVHLLVSRDASGLVSVLNGMFYAGAPLKPVTYAEYERIAGSLPLEWAVPVQLGDSYKGQWPVLATSPEFFTKFRPAEDATWTFAQGAAFAKDFELVVGAAAARATGLRIGSRVVLTHGAASSRASGVAGHEHGEFQYTVVGVLEPTGTPHDRALFSNLNSSWLIHAVDRLEREHAAGEHDDMDDHEHHDHASVSEKDLIDADRKITNIYLRVATRPGQDASAAVPVVMEHLRRHPEFQAAPLTVAGPVQEIRRLDAIVGNINQLLVIMAAVVMASSGVGIMLALYNSMQQRQRQIAVLRVLGASRGRIFGLIITESAFIGVLGAGVGLGVGMIGAQIATGVLRVRLGISISPETSPLILAYIFLMTLALSVLAGLVPAIMAYRTSVWRNLRPVA
ncbi:MAG: ABC transporter permease [Phycisphaerales bacterium]|nr:ABC transporter permease [Phycisphaerales bacterium]